MANDASRKPTWFLMSGNNYPWRERDLDSLEPSLVGIDPGP